MLRTSYLLRPTRRDGADGAAAAAPTEHLSDVYLCASSPPVIEEWVGWPDAPCVLAGSIRYFIDTRGALSPCAPAESSASRAGGTKALCIAEAKPSPNPPPELPSAVPLDGLCRAYEAADGRSGSAFLQVYSVGAHGLLSPEAKAVITGCAMAALRSRLSHLLGLLPHERLNEAGSALGMSAVAVLNRYCRASAALPPPSPSLMRPRCGTDKDGGGMRGGGWVVTWALELVLCVAASLIAAGPPLATACPPLCVSDCGEVIMASLHFGLGVRLQRDAVAHHDERTAASSMPLTSAAERRPRYAALSVQITECTPASSHPLDVRRAVDVTRVIYVDHIRSAQAYAEDGTDAFQRLARCAGRFSDPLSLATARDAWAEALQSYQASATASQGGVLFVLTHDLSAQSGPAALLPLMVREERSRSHAAEMSHDVVFPPALRDHVLASVRVRSAPAYFNHILLCQAWSSDDVVTEAYARHWADKLAYDSALAPARVAVQWRASLLVPSAKEGAAVTSGAGEGQTLAPTPLQWVLYTARRQLVVAVANRSQAVLTGRRLGLDRAAAPATTEVAPFSPSALRALAEQCVKALPVARGLLGWHCPWPVPSCLQSTGTRIAIPSAAAVEEVLWALRMLGKLRWRAAQLYEAAGDSAEQHQQLRALRADVQRWSSRRRARALAADGATLASEAAAWTPTVEDVVCHVDDGDWGALTKELSSMLPPA
ncbi:hypothetical protein, unknown function [Leishmania donovani]|uniref:Uncharacterized protein n=1 Tax=Leishmania donovani TaxID=5661 RepID=E9BA70_LEIDO|nr:hypothetical protein, unknown function [Leishmania donovani]TPP46652.1 hypothetical protein CGC21_23795 [Leishmania donovani]CBZ32143.1 hypothetical protein, unknown function [Leishmania donovani]